jgi:hypothetical protein
MTPGPVITQSRQRRERFMWNKLIDGIKVALNQEMFKSRRFILAGFAISCLTFLGYTKGIDVSISVAAIVASVAGANAYQGKGASNGETK